MKHKIINIINLYIIYLFLKYFIHIFNIKLLLLNDSISNSFF